MPVGLSTTASGHQEMTLKNKLQAPTSNSVILGPDGKPIPSTGFPRRTLLKVGIAYLTFRSIPLPVRRWLIAGATGLGLGFEGVQTVIACREQELKEAEERERSLETILFEPDPSALAQISTLFPFLFCEGVDIRFHPNADNQLLVARGIGTEHSSLMDHLDDHEHQFNVEMDDDQVLDSPNATPENNSKDLMLFSLGTLAQSVYLKSTIAGVITKGKHLLGTSEIGRCSFSSHAANVIVGSPTGNRDAALLRGKVRRRGIRSRELIHEGIPGLPLPFEFSLDADLDPGIFDGNTYRWSIIHQKPEKSSPTTYRPNGRTDYFTVSVLPNIRSQSRNPNDVPPVVLLEGCTSLGTSGASILWSAEGRTAMQILINHISSSKSRYWQALFRVTGFYERQNILRNGNEKVATSIELVGFELVYPAELAANYATTAVHSLRDDIDRLRIRGG